MAGKFQILSAIMLAVLTALGPMIAKTLNFMYVKQPVLLGANLWFSNSTGWVDTIGLNGLKKTQGNINGGISVRGLFNVMSKALMYSYTYPSEPAVGARGFIGLRVSVNQDIYESFYLGFAVHAKIISEPLR